MGAFKYVITIDADSPPPILLGSSLAGGTVTELKMEKQGLVGAAYLADKFGLSVETIRRKLAHINKGDGNKSLYDPVAAQEALQQSDRSKRGTRRKN